MAIITTIMTLAIMAILMSILSILTQSPGYWTVPVRTNLERTRYLCVGSLGSAFSLVGRRGGRGAH